jgi:hypothetical protein
VTRRSFFTADSPFPRSPAKAAPKKVDRKELIHITKLDAARRQLQTAIELWFADGDPVAVHTLVYAAHEIIHRLYRRSGHSDLLFDSKTIAVAVDRKEFTKMLKADAAFFKHAERDIELDVAHEFHPGRNELFIIISLFGLGRLVGTSPILSGARRRGFLSAIRTG